MATINLTESQTKLNNPYMGWVPDASGGPYPQPHRMVYAAAKWKDIEAVKGVYDFTSFETRYKFADWTNKGVKINFRLLLDYPTGSAHRDIPDWLYNETHDGIDYTNDYGKGYSPNYDNTLLINYHAKLIQAIAARYNNDNRIAFIQLGSIGHWGEWHCYKGTTGTLPFPKTATSNKYAQPYKDYFTNKICLLRRPYQIAKDAKWGLFNDAFGNQNQTVNYFINWFNNGYTDWLTSETQPAYPDFWKNGPSGGELEDYPGTQWFTDAIINQTLQQAKDSHTSWLGPCSPAAWAVNSAQQKNADLLLKTIGYRFVIKSVTYPDTIHAGDVISIQITIENKGVAPFYFDWPMELSLGTTKRFSGELKAFLPGIKTYTVQMIAPAAGNYPLMISIIDPAIGKPGIDFANDGRQADGRFALTPITVLPDVIVPPVSKVTSIEISGAATIPANTSQQFAATVKDQNGVVMPDEKVTWILSPANLTMDTNGKVTNTSAKVTAVSATDFNIKATVNITM
jgi:hypothetical protein